MKNGLPILVLILAAAALFSSCEGMFAPDPVITKFQHEDFSYGTTHSADGGDILSCAVEGELPGGNGTLKVIADQDGSETVLLEEEITTEEIEITDLRVPLDLDEEGRYEIFARATTADGKSDDSAAIKFDITVISVEGLHVESYAVATIDDTFTLNTMTTPLGAPSEDVTFESSDPSVVSVSDGKLNAVAGGVATITATTVDTGYSDSGDVFVAGDGSNYKDETNPAVWDINASDTEKLWTNDYTRYYVIPVTGSALYFSLDDETDGTTSWIRYTIKKGSDWSTATAVDSGTYEEGAVGAVVDSLEKGFYIVELEKDSGATNGDWTVNFWGN